MKALAPVLLRPLLTLVMWCAVAAHAAPFERGLLWEVSRPGVAPSFLFGTMHASDPRLLQLSPAVDAAFSRARTFILELYPDEAVSRRFTEATRLEGGERLSNIVSPALFEQLVERLAPRGLMRHQVDQLKPWAAMLMVSELAGDGNESLDIAFFVRARFANKRIEELDSVEEQIAVFDDLPRETQVALLATALARHDALREEFEHSIHAYLRGDLAELTRIAGRNGDDTPTRQAHYSLLEKKLIHDRSVVMAFRLQAHLRRGNVFAAVGALHLHGEKGMLQLLQDDGWTIRPLR